MAKRMTEVQLSQHEIYRQKYRNSRMNLLLVVIFTAINLILLVTNADSYFLFSAFIPYFIAGTGMLLCGRFPAEYYTDELAGMVFLDNVWFVVLLAISIAITLFYLAIWLLSRKNGVGWMIFALIIFVIDTLGMLWLNGISFESIADIIFHIWVICSLSLGIRAHYRLKKLPPEEQPAPFEANALEGIDENGEPIAGEMPNSPILRRADTDVKHKVLLAARVLNYDICYRRVKRTNELVINGSVYDEFIGLIEPPHMLQAQLDGHLIQVGYNGTHSFIEVDGENVAKKLRLV